MESTADGVPRTAALPPPRAPGRPGPRPLVIAVDPLPAADDGPGGLAAPPAPPFAGLPTPHWCPLPALGWAARRTRPSRVGPGRGAVLPPLPPLPPRPVAAPAGLPAPARPVPATAPRPAAIDTTVATAPAPPAGPPQAAPLQAPPAPQPTEDSFDRPASTAPSTDAVTTTATVPSAEATTTTAAAPSTEAATAAADAATTAAEVATAAATAATAAAAAAADAARAAATAAAEVAAMAALVTAAAVTPRFQPGPEVVAGTRPPDAAPAADVETAVAATGETAVAAGDGAGDETGDTADDDGADEDGTRRGLARLAARSVAWAVVGALLWIVLLTTVPRLAGWQPTVITGGSMEPSIGRGDVLIVRPAPATAYTPGAVITFTDPNRPGGLITHRVVRVEPDGRLRTRGDNNRDEDPALVDPATVAGRAVLRIPFAGLPVVWAMDGNWVPLAATVGLIGLAVRVALAPTSGRRRRRTGDAATP